MQTEGPQPGAAQRWGAHGRTTLWEKMLAMKRFSYDSNMCWDRKLGKYREGNRSDQPTNPAAQRRAAKEPRCAPGGPRAEPALTAPTPPALRGALPVQGHLSVTTGRTCSFWAISAPARPERVRGVVSRGCLSRTSNSGEQLRRSVGLLWAPRLWRATPPFQDPVCVSFPHGALTHRPRRCPRRHLAVPAPCPLRPGAGGWCSRGPRS